VRNYDDPASRPLHPQSRTARKVQGRPLVLLALLAAWAGGWEPPYGLGQQLNQQDESIVGTVVNEVTGEPIARALVYSADNRFAMLTDGDGRFEFTPAKVRSAFSLRLMARKPGFMDDPSQRRGNEASPGRPLTIALLPEALIKGQVMLSAGEGVADVTVQLFLKQVEEGRSRWVAGPLTKTNSNGEFRFAELLPGAYKLMTQELLDNDPVTRMPGNQLYGFPPVCFPGVEDFATAPTIQLTGGQKFEADFALVRKPYHRIRMPLANADANAGIGVGVLLQDHRGPGYSLGYNPQARRIEGLLPNGNYLVEANTFGQNAASGAANLVVAGGPADGPSMTLTQNSSLTVNVTENFTSDRGNVSASMTVGRHNFAYSGPRLYLQVSVEAADDFAEQRSTSLRPPTRPDDPLVIENLPPGRYWLRLHSSRGYVASATMGSLDLLHQPLVVGGGSSAPIEITMRDDQAEIEGAVTGITALSGSNKNTASYSEPSAYLYCVPLADSPGEFQQIPVLADGQFRSQMAPGSYRVLTFPAPQPNLPYRDTDGMREYDSKGQVVHLVPGQKENLQLQMISSNR
jgi:hypothetical protein